ncbi:MAG: hypothetical protein AB7U61_07450 [Methylocystis sp.]
MSATLSSIFCIRTLSRSPPPAPTTAAKSTELEGSDVCYELFEILPTLAPGVVVHFHDIFWPSEYPSLWAVDDNRSWNEIYALRALLTDNPKWRIKMFNDYMCKRARSVVYETYPRFFGNSGGAIWIEKIG